MHLNIHLLDMHQLYTSSAEFVPLNLQFRIFCIEFSLHFVSGSLQHLYFQLQLPKLRGQSLLVWKLMSGKLQLAWTIRKYLEQTVC